MGLMGTNEAPLLIAAIEQAKKELRVEVDQDIVVLGVAIFGTTDEHGNLLKMGLVHTLTAMDSTLAFLCEKLGFTPEDVRSWHEEKIRLATISVVSE